MNRLLAYFTVFMLTVPCSAQLTIKVNSIPKNTPENDNIYIAGNFQGWNPGSEEHILSKDTVLNLYEITLPEGTQSIEFKFTRGTWAKVESDANGKFIPNRTYTSTGNDTINLQIAGWEDLFGNGGNTSTAADNVSILADSFYMTQLERYRKIWIYLPPDYENSGLNYPVLYMQDGQNVFDDLTSFAGEWKLDETLNELNSNGDPGIIVVAVDNGGSLRMDEYASWINNSYGGGEGEAYIDFLVNDLKPYIDVNFRTLSDRENTGIMGSSLGALISLYAGIKYQEVFGKIGSFSPAYWYNPEIFDWVTTEGKSQDMRIYQLAGGLEGETMAANMFAMENKLLSAGFEMAEIKSIEKSDGAHSEWFWAREFEAAYLWLFNSNPTGSNYQKGIPDAYRLYPNPVKNKMQLEFMMSKSSRVNIEIIDSSGAYQKNAFSGFLDTGKHHLALDLDNDKLSPGIYFCQIISAEGIQNIKFVLEK